MSILLLEHVVEVLPFLTVLLLEIFKFLLFAGVFTFEVLEFVAQNVCLFVKIVVILLD